MKTIIVTVFIIAVLGVTFILLKKSKNLLPDYECVDCASALFLANVDKRLRGMIKDQFLEKHKGHNIRSRRAKCWH